MVYHTPEQTNSPGRRAAAYWFIDGLPEILFGLALLLWGATGLLVPQPWTRWAACAAGGLFWLAYLKDRRILDWLKRRLTYPRTGYVRPPADPAPPSGASPPRADENVTWFRSRTVLLFFIASQVVGFGEQTWAIPITMAGTAAVLWFVSRKGEHPYPWASLALLALSGVPFLAFDLPPHDAHRAPLALGGVWLLAHGVRALVRYLRENPRPAEAA